MSGACVARAAGWWRDKATFVHELGVHGSHAAMREAHGGSLAVLSNWRVRHGVGYTPHREGGGRGAEMGRSEHPGAVISADEATLTGEPGVSAGDVAGLIERHGLRADEWVVDRVTVNQWDALIGDGDSRTMFQLKAHLRRRASLVLLELSPARDVERRHRPGKPSSRAADRLVVVMGDQQAPYQDDELHRVVLRWLADVGPSEGVLVGDTLDFPTISRHRDRPHWSASPQECLDVGFRLLSEYRDASPGTRWRKLRGNHDWRLESELLARAERMFGLKPADRGDDEPMAYSIRRLLHLDALGVELVGTEGDDWRFGEALVASGVVVRHEPPSAQKLPRLNRSVVAGHTHRQSIRSVTVWDEDKPISRTIVETGCLCRIRGGLGYATDPDWQQGFATVSVSRDGVVGFDLASWRDGGLVWRGQVWR